MKKPWLSFLLCLAFSCPLWGASTFAADLSTSSPGFLQTKPINLNPLSTALPADAAFALSAIIELPNTIVVMWEIEEGYYLYRKSLSFTETGVNKIEAALIPDGIQIDDEFFGETEVYYNKLQVRIPFVPSNLAKGENEIQLHLSYQGCAEIGYCYPAQQKLIVLEIP